ncbi:MAG: hypothetical protein ABMB14_17475, partial [Myxococcota bacterium]
PGALVLRPGADVVERGEPAPDAGSVAAEAPPPAFAPEPPRIVGTARGRWIVVEQADGIAVIDGGRLGWQVRLHRGAGDPQRLLIPVRVGLSADALGRLDALADALGDVGLVAARFSGTEAVVRAVPSAVADLSAGDVLRVALAVGADPQAWADRLPPAPVTDDLVAQALAIGIPLPMVARVTLEGR